MRDLLIFPGRLDSSPIPRLDIAPGLRRIEIANVTWISACFLFELGAIKTANRVLAAALNQHPFFLATISVQRQLEKVRTLEAVSNGFLLILAVQQIRRRQNMVLVVPVQAAEEIMFQACWSSGNGLPLVSGAQMSATTPTR